jgi:hypothetical protein
MHSAETAGDNDFCPQNATRLLIPLIRIFGIGHVPIARESRANAHAAVQN